jgi:hypothetical protein
MMQTLIGADQTVVVLSGQIEIRSALTLFTWQERGEPSYRD